MSTEPTDAQRIRAAVIGYGHWGPNVARNIAAVAGCRLEAICDLSPARLAAAGKAHPDAMLAQSLQSLLDDPRIHAVTIATPADTHFSIALAALRAGKHVLIEKPLAGSTEEARALCAQSALRCRVLMVDHTYVYSPAVRTLARLLAEGAAGRLRKIESWRHNAGPVRHDTSVHWDLASHDLSILDCLLRDEPLEIAASGAAAAWHPLPAVDLRIAYPDSLVAEVHVSWIAPAKRRRMVVAGSAATIVYDDLDAAGRIRLVDLQGRATVVPVVDTTEPLLHVARHFVDCIGDGRASQSGGEAGARVVRMLDAADESLAGGGVPVPIDAAGAYA